MSGCQLPQSRNPNRRAVYPYVALGMYGVKSDTKTLCTPVASKPGGFHPLWDMKFTFVVDVPQLAFLRFEVRDSLASVTGSDETTGVRNLDSDPLLAQYTIKVENVRNGFRTVPLLTPTGEQLERARLFVKINLQSSQK